MLPSVQSALSTALEQSIAKTMGPMLRNATGTTSLVNAASIPPDLQIPNHTAFDLQNSDPR